MKITSLVSGLALAAAALSADAPPASACGGCFSPPMAVTSVDSHRMVVALSTDRTTLWDQIRYEGSPTDFVWVLPVPSAAATIEVADSTFFDDLENGTQPLVQPPSIPPPDCPPPPYPTHGGSFQDAAAAPDAGVTVWHEGVVGPYETATIGSTDANALRDWLLAHNYNVPAETLPVIAYYVAQGSQFIALRLAPMEGVQAMQPVRVRYPGYMATFPLKMVTVGATGKLGLTLWVIADQRFDATNYGTVTIDPNQLVWDFAQGQSNYAALFDKAIQDAGGRAFVAEFAGTLDQIYFEAQADPDVARVGLSAPFLTRLRTSTLVDMLTDDLQLAPAADASWISRYLQATQSVNTPTIQCPDYNGDGRPDTWADYESSKTPARAFLSGCAIGGHGGAALSAILGVALAALVLARRRG